MCQRATQRTFCLNLTCFPVEVFETIFQRITRRRIKVTDENCFPVVPGIRSNPANVTNRQYRQQIQTLDRLHCLRKTAHGPWFRNITFLGCIGQKQMIADQPFNRFTVFLVQPQPWRNDTCDLGPKNRMILRSALPDIMQEQSHIQNLTVHPPFQDARRDR